MNRETLIAIFLGFAGGILIAVLLLTLPKKMPNLSFLPKQNQPTPTSVTTSPPAEDQPSLIIEEPKDGSIVSDQKIEIKGKTKPESLVVVSGPAADQVLTTNAEGNFQTQIELAAGANLITTTVYLANDQVILNHLTVFLGQDL